MWFVRVNVFLDLNLETNMLKTVRVLREIETKKNLNSVEKNGIDKKQRNIRINPELNKL